MAKKSRRAFLFGAGGATLALPFLPSFTGDSGYGVLSSLAGGTARADATAPKRIVFWFGPWGVTPNFWEPLHTSADGRSFELNHLMQPLAPFQDRLTVLTGINMASVYQQEGRQGNHSIGSANAMSAAGRRQEFPYSPDSAWEVPRGPSIDQVIANRIASPSPFSSMVLGDSSDHLDQFLQAEDGSTPGMATWPHELFDRAFADFRGDDGSRERTRQSRRAMLEAVLPGYRHLSSRVSADDRRTLDAHYASLHDLAARYDTPLGVCTAPQEPERTGWDGAGLTYSDPRGPYVPLFDLAARALHCDLTRVMTIRFAGTRAHVPSIVSRYAEINPPNYSGDTHSFSHAHWRETENLEVWKEIQLWRFRLFADFLRTLDSVTDVDGRTVLDNTVVVHVSEIMTGLHEGMPLQPWGYANLEDTSAPFRPKGMPYFYVGGCGGALQTGRHFDFSNTHTYGDGLGKYSHGELFLTMARAMGVTREQLPVFGTPEVCTQEIEEILV